MQICIHCEIYLEVVFFHKLLWDHGYIYHDLFCCINLVVQVIIFPSIHMYLDLMSKMALITWTFMVCKSDAGMLTSHG